MKKTLLSIGAVVLLMSCTTPKPEQSTATKTIEKISVNTTETVATQSTSVSDYMVLKNALVKSDVALAKTAATALGRSLTNEKMNAAIIEAAKTIAGSDDLAAQRTAFKVITDIMITSLKAKGGNQGVFVQYCPMAFNNTGASWLSDSKEVLNPYFGDKMLRCGRVTEEL